MSILGGVFSRIPGRPLPDSVCESLKQAISAYPDDERSVYRDDRVCFVKVDFNAFGAPAFRVDPGGPVSMLAGHPLLDGSGAGQPRDHALDALHRDLSNGDRSSLPGARGTFCAAHYMPAERKLTLVVDKLGLRSLFVFANHEYVVFGSVLRLLEAVSIVPKEADFRAITELVTFGFPLGNRTRYANVEFLGPATVLEVTDDALSREQYWRWDQVPVSRAPASELVQRLHESFTRAVQVRLGGDRAVYSALSGGLDSRCITAVLRNLGTKVYSTNVAPAGTMDYVFSSQFAEAIGSQHENLAERIDQLDPAWLLNALRLWVAARQRRGLPPEVPRPNLLWSGAGGSVGLGHVHMSDGTSRLLRSGERDKGVQAILDEGWHRVIGKILRKDAAAAFVDLPRQGVQEELARHECEDPARGEYLYRMLNEQRRTFNNSLTVMVDEVHLEQQTPFFDADVIHTILTVPLDLCLHHRLYRKWLALLPPAVTAVPWQAYPGTEPCPVPYPPGLGDQWQNAESDAGNRRRKQAMLEEASQLLKSLRSGHPILNSTAIRLCVWMTRLGIRDYSYLINHARLYHLWSAIGGKDAPFGAARSLS